MKKIAICAALGFVIAILVVAVLSALTVFLAVNGEQTVSLGPLAETVWFSDDSVEFELDFALGWLGYALPVIGLALGAVVGAVRRPDSTLASV